MTKRTTLVAHPDSELHAALKKIKALRRADPTFDKDFEAIVVAEVKHRKQDLVEGPPVRKEPAITIVAPRRLGASKRR